MVRNFGVFPLLRRVPSGTMKIPFILLCFYIWHVCSGTGYDKKSKTCNETLINGVQKGLQYMYENKADLNFDAYFGVLLTYVQLSKIKSFKVSKALQIAQEILYEHDFHNDLNSNLLIAKIESSLMDIEKWKFTKNGENLTLPCEIDNFQVLNLTHFKREITRLLLFSKTLPDEFSSDLCIFELVSNGKMRGRKHKQCNVSDYCGRIISNENSHGYSSAHRLLYWLICRAEGCNQCIKTNAINITGKLCCQLMKEASLIESAGFPYTLRDLFMEHVVLCSLSGYSATLQDKWVNLVIDWQKPKGCWGHYDSNLSHIDNLHQKKSTTILGPDKCSSHMTGLGVLLLALGIGKG